MRVDIKDFDVDMVLGNNGVTLDIRGNDDEFVGKLRIGRATVEWCGGKTRIGNGHKFELSEFLEYLDRAGTVGKTILKKK